jgi:hypothetical protein
MDFNTQYNIGHNKYIVNYHDNTQTHKDNSKFYNIRIFKNKKKLKQFQQELLKKRYKQTN